MIHHATHTDRPARRPSIKERGEYLARVHEYCARGQDISKSKLLDLDVISIRSAARQRESLRKHITENLSNKALAKQYGVCMRNIEKILTRETWSHVA